CVPTPVSVWSLCRQGPRHADLPVPASAPPRLPCAPAPTATRCPLPRSGLPRERAASWYFALMSPPDAGDDSRFPWSPWRWGRAWSSEAWRAWRGMEELIKRAFMEVVEAVEKTIPEGWRNGPSLAKLRGHDACPTASSRRRDPRRRNQCTPVPRPG